MTLYNKYSKLVDIYIDGEKLEQVTSLQITFNENEQMFTAQHTKNDNARWITCELGAVSFETND